MKRLIAIIVLSFLLHASVAHALADCFGFASDAHEAAITESTDASSAERRASASIHCVDDQVQSGLMARTSPADLFKRQSVKLFFALLEPRSQESGEQSAAGIKRFRLAPLSSRFHTPVYLAVSILRI